MVVTFGKAGWLAHRHCEAVFGIAVKAYLRDLSAIERGHLQ